MRFAEYYTTSVNKERKRDRKNSNNRMTRFAIVEQEIKHARY